MWIAVDEGKRIGQIVDGALVQVELIPPEKRAPTLAAVGRAKEWIRVKGCRACGLADGCGGPVPFSYPEFATGSSAPFAVIGEGPGPDEDRLGRPFVGRSGRLLRAMMAEAGLPEPAFVNVVSCFPNNHGRVQEPTKAEIEACRGNLLSQIEAVGAPLLLLVGAKAVHSWRPDLSVTETRGQMYVWMRRWAVMPVMHPAALLRHPSDARKREMADDLAKFREVVSGEVDALWRLGDQCIKCGGWVTHYDEEGVPWCQKHWDQFKVHVKKAQQRLGKKGIPGQGTMI